MVNSGVFSLALFLTLAACGSGASLDAQACAANSDCSGSLVCDFGECRAPCVETKDCPAGYACEGADAGQLACVPQSGDVASSGSAASSGAGGNVSGSASSGAVVASSGSSGSASSGALVDAGALVASDDAGPVSISFVCVVNQGTTDLQTTCTRLGASWSDGATCVQTWPNGTTGKTDGQGAFGPCENFGGCAKDTSATTACLLPDAGTSCQYENERNLLLGGVNLAPCQ